MVFWSPPTPDPVVAERLRGLRLVPAGGESRDGWVPAGPGVAVSTGEVVDTAPRVGSARLGEPGVGSAELGGAVTPMPPWLPPGLPSRLAPWIERIGLGRVALAAAVLVALAGFGVGIFTGRGTRPAAVTMQPFPDLGASLPTAQPAGTAAGTAGTAPGTAGTAPGTTGTAPVADTGVVVDVQGRVRHPGLVTLAPGARVADAIRAAGGLTPGFHDAGLNLAARLTDGELLLIRRGGQAAGSAFGTGAAADPVPTGAGGDPASGNPLNLNTATEAQLEALPGIGPVLAQRILDYARQHGGFRSVSQLQDVPGIGPSHYSEIEALVTV